MTRIAVFSDTHGDLLRLDAAMALAGPLNAFLHLGDYAVDALRIAERTGLPYYAVQGNCDMASGFPSEQTVAFEKATLLITHGHRYPGIYELACRAESLHCAAALFGHTHKPLLQNSGAVILINPGSLSRPRFGSQPSFCVLEIEKNAVHIKMLPL